MSSPQVQAWLDSPAGRKHGQATGLGKVVRDFFEDMQARVVKHQKQAIVWQEAFESGALQGFSDQGRDAIVEVWKPHNWAGVLPGTLSASVEELASQGFKILRAPDGDWYLDNGADDDWAPQYRFEPTDGLWDA